MSIIGRIAYKFYYGPRNDKRTVEKFGGAAKYRQMQRNEAEMREVALNKLALNYRFNNRGRYSLNFLTAEKLIHQTLFCIHSFFMHLSDEEAAMFSVTIYEDGSLKASTLEHVRSKFPNLQFVSETDAIRHLTNNLPEENYPNLHRQLQRSVLFKKMLYIHADFKPGLKIFLDSDMLFHHRPDELLNWLSKSVTDKEAVLGLHDVVMSYGYPVESFTELNTNAGQVNINSGLYGVHTDHIDFEWVERFLSSVITTYGAHYYLEQFTTATILTRDMEKLTMLPAASYIVMPNKEQVVQQDGVLHHYVDVSKPWYFESGWRKILDAA